MKALVIGGTGPTGPFIVNGLLERGYDVTILHSGAHEATFAGPVEDIHADASFAETLQAALGDRTFDLVSCQYGRLKMAAEFFVGRTPRFIGIGASSGAGSRDPRWGPFGRPAVTDEDAGAPDPAEGGLAPRIYAARERVLELHREGKYNATYIGHPETYGPRQHSPGDWSIIKRVLDGRKHIIIADAGMKLVTRAYGENCAQAILLCIDKPKESAGQYFTVAEKPYYTIRQRIELICATLGADVELVDLPYPLAKAAHYAWRGTPRHQVKDDRKIRELLGYDELIPPAEAVVRTVHWITENATHLSHEWEEQMEDTFDYDAEDEQVRLWKDAYEKIDAVPYRTKVPAHAYRHPTRPGEPWRRPDADTKFAKGLARIEYY